MIPTFISDQLIFNIYKQHVCTCVNYRLIISFSNLIRKKVFLREMLSLSFMGFYSMDDIATHVNKFTTVSGMIYKLS